MPAMENPEFNEENRYSMIQLQVVEELGVFHRHVRRGSAATLKAFVASPAQSAQTCCDMLFIPAILDPAKHKVLHRP